MRNVSKFAEKFKAHVLVSKLLFSEIMPNIKRWENVVELDRPQMAV
jgi:hypothetical protein